MSCPDPQPDGLAGGVHSAWYEWEDGDRPRTKPRGKRAKSSTKTPSCGKGGEAKAKPSKTALQGEWGERKAEEWLVANAGLKPVARRVKVGRDEIDLVMTDPATATRPREMVFVEVKTRSSDVFGGGIGAVDRRKRHALCRAASRWMARNADCPMRIDVVEVYGDAETGRVDRMVHREAAVPVERRIDAGALGCGARARRDQAVAPHTRGWPKA